MRLLYFYLTLFYTDFLIYLLFFIFVHFFLSFFLIIDVHSMTSFTLMKKI